MNGSEERLLRDLEEALGTAVVQAIADARRKHSHESFYAYILYTLPLFDYAVLLYNTEQGLVRIASDNHQLNELRWSPPDWECNSPEDEQLFKHVNEILASVVKLLGYEEVQCIKRRKVFVDVLKRLDAQGLFGTGAARNSVLVNIMWGDQDVCAHVESARKLNPMLSYLDYARYVLPTLHESMKEIKGSRSKYKDEALARVRDTIAQVESDLHEAQS